MHLRGESDTCALGTALARGLSPGLLIYLQGELGSGKTTLVRALLRALGHDGPVRSPSYTLVESYVISRLYLYHFDFYRFHSPEEWAEAGFDELFNSGAVCLVEWPEKAGGVLPRADIEIRFVRAGEGRDVVIEAKSQAGARCVSDSNLSPDSS